MAQNIYDDPAFFAGYRELPRSRLGLAGAPEWPAVRALLPDLGGLRVVDLGCGFGWFARWARAAGAASVLGIDLSANMLAEARAATADPAIGYRQADLETLELPADGFDLAYSSLALHYVEDLPRLLRTVAAALAPGAPLVCTLEHPIFMASLQAGWRTDAQGGRFWPVDHYAIEGRRTRAWLAAGVVKQHRTMATTLNALLDAGFVLRRLLEWSPTAAELAARPELAEELDRPMLLVIAAQR